ncbi:MAG: hypothetical protein COA46_12240 [Porticoccaceae bacterium]|nr:MAG: hypothetical protein COA46_12240 [Porticoccaceae bacterium]
MAQLFLYLTFVISSMVIMRGGCQLSSGSIVEQSVFFLGQSDFGEADSLDEHNTVQYVFSHQNFNIADWSVVESLLKPTSFVQYSIRAPPGSLR